ncbi:MAG TPA: serine/threonine-protein kinase [Gemmatimonadales bacterium]|nr:serine/threonine-protein kinase [Gemmatimonadales bacterium]
MTDPDRITDWSRWAEIDALFDRALDEPVDQRAAFVDAATTDQALRHAVHRLLAALAEPDALPAQISSSARAAFDALEELEPILEAGPWRMVSPIGRGGMGSVYLAERTDGAVEQRVALKVLRRGLDTDDVLRRFRDERRILAALRHPHIARLIDAGATADGRPWLAMEYIDGIEADRWCAERHSTTRQCAQLVHLVAQAVDEAHRSLVVHRDIKPSNVLVNADGVPKLLDFGIAKLLDDQSTEHTGTAQRVLTPRYAAPEQRDGGNITTATDVYQLGALLVALSTGAPPEAALLADPARHPRLRGDIGRILAKALHADPARRYGTAGAFADDLERWLAGRPVAARPDTLRYRGARFLGRHRWIAPITLLAIILGGAWAVSAVRHAQEVTRERDLARAHATRAEAVLAFVVNLFRSADPYTARSDGLPAEMTVVEAMQQGATRVRLELDHLPDVQAELLGTITDVLIALEAPAPVDSMAQDALERTARAFGDTGEAHARALLRVGRAQAATGSTTAAEATFAAVLAHRQQQTGDLDVVAASALAELGSLRADAGDLRGAREYLTQADSLFGRLGGMADAAEQLRTIAALGNVQTGLGEADVAAATYARALDQARRTVGPRHPQVGVAEVNVGKALSAIGRHDEAATHFAAGLAILRATFGPTASTTLAATNNLANATAAAGRFDEAAAAHRELVRVRRQLSGGVPTVDVASSLQNLAVVETQRGDTVTAERLHREAAATYLAAGVTGALPAMPLLSLGGLLLARGEADSAAVVLRRARARLIATLPPTHVAVVVADCRLARSAGARHPTSATVAALRRAVDALSDPRAAPYRAECAAALAEMEERLRSRG